MEVLGKEKEYFFPFFLTTLVEVVFETFPIRLKEHCER